jgi:predicted amidohydrolase YtcJ
MQASGEEILFRNGTVFDGRAFLPAGYCVRVRQGKIVGVGTQETLQAAGDLAATEPVDLDGGTLLPGFIDAHAHPVFAGNQLRRCDLRDADTADGYLEIIAA